VPATTTDRSDEGHAKAAGSVESHIGSPPPSLLVLHPGAPQRHSQIRRTRLSVRTGPAGLPSRSKLRSVLRARPWSYKVGCAVWLPGWLPVPRSFLLIRRAGLMLGEASVTVHLRRELCRPVRRRPVMSRPRCCHGYCQTSSGGERRLFQFVQSGAGVGRCRLGRGGRARRALLCPVWRSRR
jgi:hypothetical protein